MDANFRVLVNNENEEVLTVPNTGKEYGSENFATDATAVSLAMGAIALLIVAIIVVKKISGRQKQFAIKRLSKRRILVSFLIMLSMGGIVAGIVNSHKDEKPALAISDDDSLSITVEPIAMTVEIKQGEEEKYATASHNVRVTAGTDYGYTLGVYASSSDIAAEGVDTKIKSVDDASGTVALSRNTWGLATIAPANEYAEVWHGMPNSASTAQILKDVYAPSEISDGTTVHYGVKVGGDLESGEYKTTINYIAVPKMTDDDLLEQNISFVDSKNALMNPDRGMYTPLYIQRNGATGLFGEKSDVQNVAVTLASQNLSLMHLRFNLSDWSGNANGSGVDLPITEEQANSIGVLFDVLRKFGIKAIIRCSYDVSARIGQEPKSIETVMQHIEALGNVFSQNKDVITALDVGMLGPWGEMHSTTGIYDNDEAYRRVILKWLEVLPNDITANVRVPNQYKIAFGSYDNDSANKYRLGIFNDGYLGSSTDLGTFTTEFTRDDFIEWMGTQGDYTFYGGEVTRANPEDEGYTEDMEPWSEGSYAAYEMPLTHTSYFNSQFNLKILRDKWQNQIYDNDDDEYDGETYYKYLTDHIGYRIVLRDSRMTPEVSAGAVAAIKLNLDNVGFARVIQKHEMNLILEKDGQYYSTKLDTDISELSSQSNKDYIFVFSVPSGIDPGEWNVYLRINNVNSEDYAIRFANADIYNEDLRANKIGEIIIAAGGEGDTSFAQMNTDEASEEKQGAVVPKKSYVPVYLTYMWSNSGEQLDSEVALLPRGETINASDTNYLKSLGFGLLEKYYQPKFHSALTNWQLSETLTVPTDETATGYWVNLYVKKSLNPDFEFTYSYDGEIVGRSYTDAAAPGTAINVNDTEQLTALGITPPEGYKITLFASGDLTDWAGVTVLNVPSENYNTKYWVTAIVAPN